MPPQDEARWHAYAVQEAVNAALEAERSRLAQQLDATLISQINLVLAQIRSYELTTSGDARTALSVLSSLARQLLQSTYDLQAGLNPTTLETLGLEPALEALTNQHRRSTGVSIVLALPHRQQRLPAHIELALFRITQDIIDHSITQGSATRIDIRLEYDADGLRYSIVANGSVAAASLAASARQRIEWLGGQLHLAEDPDHAINLTIEFRTEHRAELTEREMAVIHLLAEGLSNAEIAAQLAIRPRTVKFHLDNIYSKLDVNTRTAAAIYALRQGWVRRHPPA